MSSEATHQTGEHDGRPLSPSCSCFCCNWCSYAGADLAGVSRLRWPPLFRTIRVMCSARVDPEFIIRAFQKGADGVLVAGCHPADCHYIGGNYRTRRDCPHEDADPAVRFRPGQIETRVGLGRVRVRSSRRQSSNSRYDQGAGTIPPIDPDT